MRMQETALINMGNDEIYMQPTEIEVGFIVKGNKKVQKQL